MFIKIKNRIEKELTSYIKDINKLYSLSSISPLLYHNIKEFLCRKGKRVRPILFVFGYFGFAQKPARNIYRCAVSLELLHDFMLVHDDVIDKSDTRRGQPSMHKMLSRYLANKKNVKFSGQDLTIVAGDVMFAMALHAFLSVKETQQTKEAALGKLIAAALYTGSGEFLELIDGMKTIDLFSRRDIYKIYDLKTANYTFASPLAIGASLAGAKKEEVDKLFRYGIYLGRAFQIKDDIIGIFGKESKIGKPNLTDLQEGKKTILIRQAYQQSNPKDKLFIKNVLSKPTVSRNDLLRIRKIIINSGALDHTEIEINRLINKAKNIIKSSKMTLSWKKSLALYAEKILKL